VYFSYLNGHPLTEKSGDFIYFSLTDAQ
jgi:hypothetical protein